MLSTLSAKRPRWLIELCIEAAREAHRQGKSSIDCESTMLSMKQFGINRIQDLSAEYAIKCSQLPEIMNSFNGSTAVFKRSHNLLHHIKENILENFDVKITGNKKKITAVDVANLLYSINFIQAKKNSSSGEYEHIYFYEKPHLLSNEKQANSDELFSWEIHPMFRNTLFLQQNNKMENKQLPKINRHNNQRKKMGRNR